MSEVVRKIPKNLFTVFSQFADVVIILKKWQKCSVNFVEIILFTHVSDMVGIKGM